VFKLSKIKRGMAMKVENFTFKDKGNLEIFVYKWLPDENVKPKGVVQIAHGMAETAGRYGGFANALTDNGFTVYANDHRGHGKTAGNIEKLGDLGKMDLIQWWKT